MDVKNLINKTLSNISLGDETYLTFTDGSRWRFCHYQDCCESVILEDWMLPKEIPCTILNATDECEYGEDDYETFTRHKFIFNTDRGDFYLTWLGTSNGYYSEDVSLEFLDDDGEWNGFKLGAINE